jgi:type III restriction enzyme
MKELKYQHKAVKELVDKTIDLLGLNGNRHILVFKAPTGSGKTVMASEMLLHLNEELEERPDSPYTKIAYIWIAPNKLHEQSYFKMKNYFTETQDLHPIIYDELDHSINGYIKPGEILFVNWESINKDNAIMTRDTELSASLYDITRRTQEENGVPIVVIIDEEHMFGSNNAKKSEIVLTNIQPKVEIRISATPLPETAARADEQVNVQREKVIEEEMIKEGVILNPALKFTAELGSLNQHLIHLALEKRDELANAYKELGININPLLLIQLPNDGDNMDANDNTVKEEVLTYLDNIKSINANNHKLAIWLSSEKTNLDGIEELDNMTEVLLFKQAIALGWDCPRAAVLLIFRKIESYTFSAQTVGRILRMPEQKFYQDVRLNRGYVYTNLSKDIMQIVQDDMDYMTMLHSERRKTINNVVLISEYNERTSAQRNRLGSDFKATLIKAFENNWLVKDIEPSLFTAAELDGDEEVNPDENERKSQAAINREAVKGKINFNVSSISIDIVEDLEITGEVGTTMIQNKAKYVRTSDELETTFLAFCAKALGGTFEKVSIKTLALDLEEAMEGLFELFENEAIKVILYYANRPKFEDIIKKALEAYMIILRKRQTAQKSKGYEKYNWEIPIERLYNEDTNEVNEKVQNHALMPFIQLKGLSGPEKSFEEYLENNTEYIDWWYKNGDSGKQHFSISYTNSKGEKSLFYVDFIIRMKNGQIFLFDTKSAGSDNEGVNKHNALIDYINDNENKDRHLKGGIIIQDGENWKYSSMHIENTTEIVNWDCFYPNEYKI